MIGAQRAKSLSNLYFFLFTINTTLKHLGLKKKKIDPILDKIIKSGYDSLTKKEKEFLFQAGKTK